LQELKAAYPQEVEEVLDFYKIGDITVETLYS
jgi:hypothetical protein